MGIFAFLAVLLSVVGSPAQTSDVNQWLVNVDAARNAFEEAVITARATQIESGTITGTADFDVYVKGRERGLIVFRGGKNSGRKILTSGDKMWLIVPGATNAVPITPNQRLVGGASVGDVARLRLAEDYDAVVRPGTEAINGETCRVVDLTAKSPRAAFPRVVLWYDEADRLPVRLLFALPSGKPAKEVTFTKFTKAFGKTVVAEMEVRDLLAKDANTVTRLEYRDVRPARLDDKIFTPEGAKGI
ncbi:MAG TPA: outer membrane lipoprotein-sorting protein [Thermoanaerobaculia bacterium]|nr:outer membrane lipoprotein-sorting protein [Thermoanaerobaculia bacterium]